MEQMEVLHEAAKGNPHVLRMLGGLNLEHTWATPINTHITGTWFLCGVSV